MNNMNRNKLIDYILKNTTLYDRATLEQFTFYELVSLAERIAERICAMFDLSHDGGEHE